MTINPYESPKVSAEEAPLDFDDGIDGELRYSVDLEDVLAFHEFHAINSPAVRNQLYGWMVLVGVVSIAPVILRPSQQPSWLRLAIAFAIAIMSSLIIRPVMKWNVRRHVRTSVERLYRDYGKNEGVFGAHRLLVTVHGLIEQTAVSESRHDYSTIARIEDTPEFVLIFVSAFCAHIIPKKKLEYGNIESFMARLRELVSDEVNAAS